MYQVKYDMPDAQASFEFILEQLIHGAEVIILRHGIEIARLTAMDSVGKGLGNVLLQPSQPYS